MTTDNNKMATKILDIADNAIFAATQSLYVTTESIYTTVDLLQDKASDKAWDYYKEIAEISNRLAEIRLAVSEIAK